jgi:hypothetical protein
MFRSQTLKRALLATLGALLLALAAAAPAGAAWSDAFVSSSSLTPAVTQPPGMAIDGDGDSFYVWAREDKVIQGRKRSAAGRLGPVLNLSKTAVVVPEALMFAVAANPRGDSLYAWPTTSADGTQYLIQGRFRAADGTLGPIRNLVAQSKDAGEIVDFDLALSNNRSGVVVWHNQSATSDIKARVRSATGRMGAVLNVASGGLDGKMASPEVEMDNGGEAIFAWQQETSTVKGQIHARVLSSTGALGPPMTLASPNATFGGVNGTASQLAVNPRGDAAFTWSRKDLATGKDVIEGRVLTDGNVLKPTVKLSAGDTEVSKPEVDIANSGAAVFAWAQKNPTFGKVQLLGRSLSATNVLGPTNALSGTVNDVFHGHVGVKATGDALFLWADKNATTGKPVIQSRALTAAGALGPVVSVADLESEAQGLELAVAADGDAAAAWFNSSVKQIQAAFGP